MDISAIQDALRRFQLDGWLLYDFRGSNPLARRVLELESAVTTRRFLYFVPADGPPKKLVHRIESAVLDHLAGERDVYLTWQEFAAKTRELLANAACVAMEYAPSASNPYVSRVDAGTVELVRASGVDVRSSGDLIQQFEATWSDEQWSLHREAGRWTDKAFEVAWEFIRTRLVAGESPREEAVQAAILSHFGDHDLVTSHPPIVAVGRNSGDPHYEPVAGRDAPIEIGDFVLIDLWAKLDKPHAVYSDLTRVAYVGDTVPERYAEIFSIVAAARDAAITAVRSAFAKNEAICGWQVDRAAREVIEQAGYGDFFIHRTGHSIGTETHGNGANMDDLEMHDERRILPRTCFSVEPGIYLPEFGIRSEVNVFVDENKGVHVTAGAPQTSVLALRVG